MDRVDSIADPDHIGHVSAQRSGFSLSRMLFGLTGVTIHLGRPSSRPEDGVHEDSLVAGVLPD
jgi:hypothetical protein